MRRSVVACSSIAVAVVAVYAQVAGHEFVEYDDGLYVTHNATVQQGLSWDNVVWAFTTLDAHIWHPLTWLHYLVDAELYGVGSAGPWLLTNVAWHVAASLVLLGALASLTGRLWPSAFAAALFALHPIQTEPVAWASGRKEVMAGCFAFLTVWAYARYARRRDARSYLAVFGAMLLCLGAKGTQVTLPFLLLLLDYWPLGRLRPFRPGGELLANLVLEKLPLLFAALAVVLVQATSVSGVYGPWVEDPPLLQRALDGVMAYVATLGRLVWPDDLAIIHPTPAQMGLAAPGALAVGAALAALGLVTALAALAGPRRGYLLVGWLWFLGALFPLIGIVPSGLRVMHDRYAYVPMVGLAIAVSFAAADLLARLRAPRAVPIATGLALLAVCAAASYRQAGVWRDTQTLFGHALAVTERNAIVHFYRGNTLAGAGDRAGARAEIEAALAIHPSYPEANEALGRLHLLEERPDLAIPHLERAVDARPEWPQALDNLARAQHSAGRLSAAADSYRRLLRLDPEHPSALRGLAALRRELRSRRPSHAPGSGPPPG